MVALSRATLTSFTSAMGAPAASLENDILRILDIPAKNAQDFDDSGSIYLFIREGGLPIRALDPDERKAMESHGEQRAKASNVPTYTDSRYEEALPPGLEIPSEISLAISW